MELAQRDKMRDVMRLRGGLVRIVVMRDRLHLSLTVVLVLCVQVLIGRSVAQAHELTFSSGAGSASLVELYTSEGCSSCPPAEKWLGDLKNSPGLWTEIFPVNFHVDYWDGLGWPDRFASPSYTQRQRDYAARLGQDSVYTPEFVVDGAEFRGWFHGQPLPQAGAKSGELKVSLEGDKISGSYEPPAGNAPRELTLHLAILGAGLVSDVKAGENDGRRLKHDFIVLGFRSVPLEAAGNGELQATPVTIKSATGDAPAAVVGWVSDGGGAILQIAGGWLSSAR
jgi:hypothetical protein